MDENKIKDLFQLLPEGSFGSEQELGSYVTDEAKLKELFDLMPEGSFSSVDEYSSYFGSALKKKGEAYLPTVENLQKDFSERQLQLASDKPVSREETLSKDFTVSSVIKASTAKDRYASQEVDAHRNSLIKEIEDFDTELNASYAEKAKKEGADIKALEEEAYWKHENFVAAKQKDLEKKIDDLGKDDQYENLGDGDIKLLTKQLDYVMSTPMEFGERDKVVSFLKDRFMSKLSGMPEEYRSAVEAEVTDFFAKKTLFNSGGQANMYGWKKEASAILGETQASRERIQKEFLSKYPDFSEKMIAQPGGTYMTTPTREKGETTKEFYRDYNQYKRDLYLLGTSEEKIGRVLQFPDNLSNIITPFKEGGRDLLASISSAGYSDIAKSLEDGTISRKVQSGEKLSVGEEAAFKTKGVFDAAQTIIPESPGRTLGGVIAQGIPFIEQMATMGLMGINIGASTFKELLKKEGVKALSTKGAALIGKGVGKATATAFAISPLMPISWTRQQSGLAGQQELDKEGNWVIAPGTVEKWWEATVKGLATGGTEALSEMAGGFIGEFGGVFNKIAKLTGSKMRMPKGLTEFMKNAKVGSTPVEIFEELINYPLQAPIGDQPLSEVTLDDIWETVWTTAGFTTILGSGAIAGAPWQAIKRNRDYGIVTTFGRDKVAGLRDAVLNHDKVAWEKAMADAIVGFDPETAGMSLGTAQQRLAEYSKSLAIEAAARSERVIKAEDKDQEMLAPAEVAPSTIAETAQVEAPAAEAIDTEAAPVVNTEIAPAEEETSGGTKTTETLPETEILDNGDVLYQKKGEVIAPDPEVKPRVRAELERLNSLSEGQKVVLVEGMVFPEGTDARVSKAFAKNADMLGLHLPGEAQSYINVDNITSVEEARAVCLHESGVHGGVERLFDTR
jgi:hypothetical protein